MKCLKVLALVVLLALTGCDGGGDEPDMIAQNDPNGIYVKELERTNSDPVVTPTVPTKPTVPVSTSYPNVAGNGILWKPVADSGGDLVVLLAPSYGKPTVLVCRTDKTVIEQGRFVYFSNPNRATYRFSKSGPQLKGTYGSVLLNVGGKYFIVSDPSRRYE